MFHTSVSQSHLTSLDEVVVARLAQHRESGRVLRSSVQEPNGHLNPASDYDVLVVLSEMPVPVSLVLTTIEHRLAEVVFFFLLTPSKSGLPPEKRFTQGSYASFHVAAGCKKHAWPSTARARIHASVREKR